MNGRYAFVYDSQHRCLEGVRRLQEVLTSLDISMPRVFLLPEANSAVMAHALAQALGCGLAPWPEGGSDNSGIIATDILQENRLGDELGDKPALLALARAAAECPQSATPNAPCLSGWQQVQYSGSAVQSHRFD